jgi:GNAT superfamily N-acetyltransferase
LLRCGQGGGKRVSAATAEADWQAADIDRAAAAMRAMGQPQLFLIREGDSALDRDLARRGYGLVDPVVAYVATTGVLAGTAPAPMTSFPHWPPMEIAKALWAEGGIAAARLAVMGRVVGPKTCILARANDRASGVAFVACHGRHAMLHALEVTPALRRQGSAQNILRAAAAWASAEGVDTLSVVVTEANDPARRLYAEMGMTVAGQYHYRQICAGG